MELAAAPPHTCCTSSWEGKPEVNCDQCGQWVSVVSGKLANHTTAGGDTCGASGHAVHEHHRLLAFPA
jgi:hypothetical protein